MHQPLQAQRAGGAQAVRAEQDGPLATHRLAQPRRRPLVCASAKLPRASASN
jgi:hypothetical protein